MKKIPANFFARRTDVVAKKLLGKILAKDGMKAKIVETEAYMDEPGSHAHEGNKTPRNAVMFGPPGHIYVYFTYGIHHMLNFVCEEEGTPGAVLIRAGEPLEGMERMIENRGRKENLTNGPARLTQAFGIDTRHNGQKVGTEIEVLDSKNNNIEIGTSTRIGLSKGENLPLRFYVVGNQWVSKK